MEPNEELRSEMPFAAFLGIEVVAAATMALALARFARTTARGA